MALSRALRANERGNAVQAGGGGVVIGLDGGDALWCGTGSPQTRQNASSRSAFLAAPEAQPAYPEALRPLAPRRWEQAVHDQTDCPSHSPRSIAQ
jgi:hypothetical protein